MSDNELDSDEYSDTGTIETIEEIDEFDTDIDPLILLEETKEELNILLNLKKYTKSNLLEIITLKCKQIFIERSLAEQPITTQQLREISDKMKKFIKELEPSIIKIKNVSEQYNAYKNLIDELLEQIEINVRDLNDIIGMTNDIDPSIIVKEHIDLVDKEDKDLIKVKKITVDELMALSKDLNIDLEVLDPSDKRRLLDNLKKQTSLKKSLTDLLGNNPELTNALQKLQSEELGTRSDISKTDLDNKMKGYIEGLYAKNIIIREINNEQFVNKKFNELPLTSPLINQEIVIGSSVMVNNKKGKVLALNLDIASVFMQDSALIEEHNIDILKTQHTHHITKTSLAIIEPALSIKTFYQEETKLRQWASKLGLELVSMSSYFIIRKISNVSNNKIEENKIISDPLISLFQYGLIELAKKMSIKHIVYQDIEYEKMYQDILNDTTNSEISHKSDKFDNLKPSLDIKEFYNMLSGSRHIIEGWSSDKSADIMEDDEYMRTDTVFIEARIGSFEMNKNLNDLYLRPLKYGFALVSDDHDQDQRSIINANKISITKSNIERVPDYRVKVIDIASKKYDIINEKSGPFSNKDAILSTERYYAWTANIYLEQNNKRQTVVFTDFKEYLDAHRRVLFTNYSISSKKTGPNLFILNNYVSKIKYITMYLNDADVNNIYKQVSQDIKSYNQSKITNNIHRKEQVSKLKKSLMNNIKITITEDLINQITSDIEQKVIEIKLTKKQSMTNSAISRMFEYIDKINEICYIFTKYPRIIENVVSGSLTIKQLVLANFSDTYHVSDDNLELFNRLNGMSIEMIKTEFPELTSPLTKETKETKESLIMAIITAKKPKLHWSQRFENVKKLDVLVKRCLDLGNSKNIADTTNRGISHIIEEYCYLMTESFNEYTNLINTIIYGMMHGREEETKYSKNITKLVMSGSRDLSSIETNNFCSLVEDIKNSLNNKSNNDILNIQLKIAKYYMTATTNKYKKTLIKNNNHDPKADDPKADDPNKLILKDLSPKFLSLINQINEVVSEKFEIALPKKITDDRLENFSDGIKLRCIRPYFQERISFSLAMSGIFVIPVSGGYLIGGYLPDLNEFNTTIAKTLKKYDIEDLNYLSKFTNDKEQDIQNKASMLNAILTQLSPKRIYVKFTLDQLNTFIKIEQKLITNQERFINQFKTLLTSLNKDAIKLQDIFNFEDKNNHLVGNYYDFVVNKISSKNSKTSNNFIEKTVSPLGINPDGTMKYRLAYFDKTDTYPVPIRYQNNKPVFDEALKPEIEEHIRHGTMSAYLSSRYFEMSPEERPFLFDISKGNIVISNYYIQLIFADPIYNRTYTVKIGARNIKKIKASFDNFSKWIPKDPKKYTKDIATLSKGQRLIDLEDTNEYIISGSNYDQTNTNVISHNYDVISHNYDDVIQKGAYSFLKSDVDLHSNLIGRYKEFITGREEKYDISEDRDVFRWMPLDPDDRKIWNKNVSKVKKLIADKLKKSNNTQSAAFINYKLSLVRNLEQFRHKLVDSAKNKQQLSKVLKKERKDFKTDQEYKTFLDLRMKSGNLIMTPKIQKELDDMYRDSILKKKNLQTKKEFEIDLELYEEYFKKCLKLGLIVLDIDPNNISKKFKNYYRIEKKYIEKTINTYEDKTNALNPNTVPNIIKQQTITEVSSIKQTNISYGSLLKNMNEISKFSNDNESNDLLGYLKTVLQEVFNIQLEQVSDTSGNQIYRWSRVLDIDKEIETMTLYKNELIKLKDSQYRDDIKEYSDQIEELLLRKNMKEISITSIHITLDDVIYYMGDSYQQYETYKHGQLKTTTETTYLSISNNNSCEYIDEISQSPYAFKEVGSKYTNKGSDIFSINIVNDELHSSKTVSSNLARRAAFVYNFDLNRLEPCFNEDLLRDVAIEKDDVLFSLHMDNVKPIKYIEGATYLTNRIAAKNNNVIKTYQKKLQTALDKVSRAVIGLNKEEQDENIIRIAEKAAIHPKLLKQLYLNKDRDISKLLPNITSASWPEMSKIYEDKFNKISNIPISLFLSDKKPVIKVSKNVVVLEKAISDIPYQNSKKQIARRQRSVKKR